MSGKASSPAACTSDAPGTAAAVILHVVVFYFLRKWVAKIGASPQATVSKEAV
jgi:hypothetical protein